MSIQILTDPHEMYALADQFGLSDLVYQAASEIDARTDQHPGSSQSVINKAIKGESAFVVIMVARSGLFADAVMLISTLELSEPVSSTVEEIAQDFARRMLETLGDRCTCDRCGRPTNLS